MRRNSGGTALTRARLSKALAGLPVNPVFTARNRPFEWTLDHNLDRRRSFHPYSQMPEAEFGALRDPDMETAAQRLADAGYHVMLRRFPDHIALAELPESLRGSLAGIHPMLQVWLIPDMLTQH